MANKMLTEKDIFCHAPKCDKKYPDLKKWGYCQTVKNGKKVIYCMEHQSRRLLKGE